MWTAKTPENVANDKLFDRTGNYLVNSGRICGLLSTAMDFRTEVLLVLFTTCITIGTVPSLR